MTARSLLAAALVVGLALAGCGGSATPDWRLAPEPSGLDDVSSPTGWPPAGPVRAQVLSVQGQVGRALVQDDALWVPTGFGLRRLGSPGADSGIEVATPGWATAVVAPSPGLLWVADGQAGVAVLRARGRDLDLVGSAPLGEVTSLATVGAQVLAAVQEGALLLLEPDEDGMPRSVASLVLDGRPALVDAWPSEHGWSWAAAVRSAGVVRGEVTQGRLVPTWTSARWGFGVTVAGAPARLLTSDQAGRVRDHVQDSLLTLLPSRAADMGIDSTGRAWFATRAGVLAEGNDGVETVRDRDGVAAVAIAADPTQAGVVVSWQDGSIERLGADGEPLHAWSGGSAGRTTGVGDDLVLVRDAGGGQALMPLDGSTALELESDVVATASRDATVLVATPGLGLMRLEPGRTGLVPRLLRAGEFLDVAFAPDGSLWAGHGKEGLQRLRSDGTTAQAWPTSGGSEATAVDVSERWAVGVEWAHGGFVAIDRDQPAAPPLLALLPGQATDVLILGDHALVAIAHVGVAAVPLTSGGWPEPATLRLPLPATARALSLCRAGSDGAMVTLDQAGVALIRLDGGAPVLELRIDTPGRAAGCAPSGTPGSWLVADTSGLIELTVEQTGSQ